MKNFAGGKGYRFIKVLLLVCMLQPAVHPSARNIAAGTAITAGSLALAAGTVLGIHHALRATRRKKLNRLARQLEGNPALLPMYRRLISRRDAGVAGATIGSAALWSTVGLGSVAAIGLATYFLLPKDQQPVATPLSTGTESEVGATELQAAPATPQAPEKPKKSRKSKKSKSKSKQRTRNAVPTVTLPPTVPNTPEQGAPAVSYPAGRSRQASPARSRVVPNRPEVTPPVTPASQTPTTPNDPEPAPVVTQPATEQASPPKKTPVKNPVVPDKVPVTPQAPTTPQHTVSPLRTLDPVPSPHTPPLPESPVSTPIGTPEEDDDAESSYGEDFDSSEESDDEQSSPPASAPVPAVQLFEPGETNIVLTVDEIAAELQGNDGNGWDGDPKIRVWRRPPSRTGTPVVDAGVTVSAEHARRLSDILGRRSSQGPSDSSSESGSEDEVSLYKGDTRIASVTTGTEGTFVMEHGHQAQKVVRTPCDHIGPATNSNRLGIIVRRGSPTLDIITVSDVDAGKWHANSSYFYKDNELDTLFNKIEEGNTAVAHVSFLDGRGTYFTKAVKRIEKRVFLAYIPAGRTRESKDLLSPTTLQNTFYSPHNRRNGDRKYISAVLLDANGQPIRKLRLKKKRRKARRS